MNFGNNFIDLCFFITIVLLLIFFVVFGYSSIKEKKNRAQAISLIAVVLALIFLVYFENLIQLSDTLKTIVLTATYLLFALYFLPLGKTKPLTINKSNLRFDERDTIFAREEYEMGTEKYDRYYKRKPEYKLSDDRIRKLPRLLDKGGRYYQPEKSIKIKETFREIQAITTKVDGDVSPNKVNQSAEQFTAEIKSNLLAQGAVEVGIALMKENYIYSHVGRGPEEYGSEIVNNHKYAIVYTVEMDYNMVEQAPDIPITEEAAKQYLKTATISVELAKQIRAMGYSARAHISDSNYQIILPAVANEAGLGELGRLGYLISEKLGPRVRLGGITTDLPLITDKPKHFGVQQFCVECRKCADNCPSQAITYGDKTEVRGVEKWQLDIEKCLYYWRVAGTDCGLCMKVCPYSHPPTVVHNLVRYAIKKSAFARKVSILGDDLFYGKKAKFYQMENKL